MLHLAYNARSNLENILLLSLPVFVADWKLVELLAVVLPIGRF